MAYTLLTWLTVAETLGAEFSSQSYKLRNPYNDEEKDEFVAILNQFIDLYLLVYLRAPTTMLDGILNRLAELKDNGPNHTHHPNVTSR